MRRSWRQSLPTLEDPEFGVRQCGYVIAARLTRLVATALKAMVASGCRRSCLRGWLRPEALPILREGPAWPEGSPKWQSAVYRNRTDDSVLRPD